MGRVACARNFMIPYVNYEFATHRSWARFHQPRAVNLPIPWDEMMANSDISRKIDADMRDNLEEFMSYIASRSTKAAHFQRRQSARAQRWLALSSQAYR